MRIGLFISEDQKYDCLADLITQFGDEIVGYSSIRPNSDLSSKLNYEPYPIELLAGCDTAIVYPAQGVWAEVPRAAIRRGINLYLADLPSYSKHSLVELQNLLQEIKVSVEFGFSGLYLNDYLQDINLPNESIFVDFRRDLSKNSDFSLLKRTLIFDLATMLRINLLTIKKVRVFSLPLRSTDYTVLNVRIEFANGSTYCYTINRLSKEDSISLNIYGNQAQHQIIIKPNGTIILGDNKLTTNTPISFVNQIKSGGEPNFSVDKAIELYRLYDEINEKLAMFSA